MTSGRHGLTGVAIGVALSVLGCSGAGQQPSAADRADRPSSSASPSASTPTTPAATEETVTAPETPAPPPDFEADRAVRTVRALAGRIGPREATSDAYFRAADLVQERFTALGYDVSRQAVPVPAGVSWGVPVPAGRSVNVIADQAGFDPDRPHLVIGAHLDTVPQAPGAEDNASGVSVLLELARLASRADTRLPVRFIAFGAEEPRGAGEALHHFGSKRYVQRLDGPARKAVRGMLSLDRVGVSAPQVPVCTGGLGTLAVQRALLAAARSVDVPAQPCDNTASDHWSFEQEGIPAARLGSVPYDAYHSVSDVPSVVDRDQLDRVGRLAWAWLQPRTAR